MKMIKRILIWGTLLIIFVIGVLVSLGYVFRDEIVDYVLVELNKEIRSDIKVDKIDLSLISNFPKASLNFKNVTGFEPESKTDTLFDFEEVALSFNIKDLYAKKYVLQDIKISEGTACLKTAKNGTSNYEIWYSDKGADTVETNPNFKIDLSKVKLKNVRVIWQNDQTEELYDIAFISTTAKGQFSQSTHNTALYGKARINSIEVAKNKILPNEKVDFDLGFEVDQNAKLFQLSRGLFTLRDQFNFNVKGKFFDDHFNLNYDAHKLDLESLKGLFPKEVQQKLTDYSGKGKLEVSGSIEKKKKRKAPKINLSFTLDKGEVFYEKTKTRVSNLSLSGSYTNGKRSNPSTTKLILKNVEGDFENGRLKGELELSNFDRPNLSLAMDAHYQLSDLLAFMPNELIAEGKGKVAINITFDGRLSSLNKPEPQDLVKAKTTGKISLEDVSFKLAKNKLNYHNINLKLNLNNDRVQINKFSGQASDSDVQLKGVVQNLLPFIFYKNQPIFVKADLVSNKVDLNQILSGNETKEQKEDYILDLPSTIKLDLKVAVKELTFQSFEAANIKGGVVLKENQLNVNKLTFESCQGNWNTSLTLMEKDERDLALKTSTSIKHVDVSELFQTFGEFGQKSITHQHIKGEAHGNVQFGCIISRTLKIQHNSIKSIAEVELTNGELIGYKPLYTMVDDLNDNKFMRLFVKLDDFRERLKHVKFSKLRNTLKIENEMISIPEMDIYSSAMAIHLSGNHTFSNVLDYKFRFNLKDVLTKNKKVIKETEYGYVKDDGAGNKMIFLSMKGDIDNLTVSFDKQARKRYNKKQVKRELNVTKQILKEEFGLFKSDSTLTNLKEENAEIDVDFGEFNQANEPSSEEIKKVKVDSSKTKKKKKGFWNKIKQKSATKKEEFQEFEFEDDDF